MDAPLLYFLQKNPGRIDICLNPSSKLCSWLHRLCRSDRFCLLLLLSIFRIHPCNVHYNSIKKNDFALHSIHSRIRMAWHISLIFRKLVFLLHFSLILSQHCEKDQCDGEQQPSKEVKKCKYWDPTQFNEDTPSIVYGKITYKMHFIYMWHLYNFTSIYTKIIVDYSHVI